MHKLTPSANPKKSVFISHAYADNDVCRALASALQERGYAVWLDLDQKYATHEISQVVRDALVASDALLVVLSEAALRSKWVREEYAYFRDYPNRSRPIVSIKVDACRLRAEPRLALTEADLIHDVDLEDLAAIDATRIALDEVVGQLESLFMSPPIE